MDEEGVLDFLTSLEAMDLPDRIEEVNARILEKIVQETEYVAVLFCKYKIIEYIFGNQYFMMFVEILIIFFTSTWCKHYFVICFLCVDF